ncbi:hypothetical protein [Streptomyces fulvorobeus]|uniref:Uncharacterized protein n=1 Tax=Streptomyces fulvorobeus TaxID=284028 RepID=A0A7Y9KXT5_9ACTN|nr:hypothetical protein [Streptomyces fulvorobeus]NYE42192.1 hypothetical protein [Streptomyces fulvorobeus]
MAFPRLSAPRPRRLPVHAAALPALPALPALADAGGTDERLWLLGGLAFALAGAGAVARAAARGRGRGRGHG